MKLNKLVIYIVSISLISVLMIGCANNAKPMDKNESADLQDDNIQIDNDYDAFENLPTYERESDDAEELADEQDEQTASMKQPESANGNIGKRVICYGDSLTEGTGGNGVTWPGTVEAISGATVLNYGVFGEASSCIAARQGGNPQYLNDDIVVPADCTPVHAQVSGKYGWEMLLVFGDAGINNCSIGGIEGTYFMDDDGNRMFTRLAPGEEKAFPAGTPFLTHAMMDKQPDDIMVIYAGSNDTLETLDDIPVLVQKIKEMVDYHGNDKYVVVSLTSRHSRIPIVDDVNKALEKEFGKHYLNLRQFMVYESLDQLGIAPTDHDKDAISKGDVPFSIRLSEDEEENHGNSDFYRLVGEQIYKKLVELGYLD